MGREKNIYDKAYNQGYNDSKEDSTLGNVVHNLTKDVHLPWDDEKIRQSYNAGYEDGALDRDDDSNSHYSGGSGNENDSSCFVTTATLTAIGKSNYCDELNVFRAFRDNWLVKQTDGPYLISQYYKIAPKIVEKIDLLPNRELIYGSLWRDNINPCLDLLNNNKFSEAKELYKITILTLMKAYL